MRRAVHILLLALALAGSALAVPEARAQSAEGDRGLLQRFIEDRLSDAGREVRIEGFSGALSAQVQIAKLTIADAAGVWLRLQGVRLDWTRSALLAGRLEVNRLTAETIAMPRRPRPAISVEDSRAKPFSLPDLPVAIEIGEIAAQRVSLGAPVLGEAVDFSVAGGLRLSGGTGAADLQLTRSDGRGKISLDAAFSNETRILALDLRAREAAGGLAARLLGIPGRPALELTLAGEGPLSDYAADLTLATEGVPRLQGRVAIAAAVPDEAGDTTPDTAVDYRFTADLGGDLRPLVQPDLRRFFGADSHMQATGLRHGDGALTVERLDLRTAALEVTGRLALDPAGWPRRFALDGRVGLTQGGAVRLPLGGPPTTLRQADIRARFDADKGDRWRARITAQKVARGPLRIDRLALRGGGTIRPRAAPPAATADLTFAATGVAHDDPALARALGEAIEGDATLAWARDAPLDIAGLTLSADDARLTGSARVSGLRSGFAVDGTARVDAPDLTRFAALAGRDLAGGAEMRVNGRTVPLSGAFDLTLDAQTRDLALGLTRLDPLLRGAGRVAVKAVRDGDGTRLERLELTAPAATLQASGRLDPASGELQLTAQLSDVAMVAPRLSGAARAEGQVGWQQGGAVELRDLAVELGETTARVTGRVWPDRAGLPAEGRLTLDVPALSQFAALTGQPLKGGIAGWVAGAGPLGALRGDAAAEGGDLRLSADLQGQGLATGISDLDRLLGGHVSLALDALRRDGKIEVPNVRLETRELSLKAAQGDDGRLPLSARLTDLGLFTPGLSGPLSLEGAVQIAGPAAARIGLALDLRGPGGMQARLGGNVFDLGRRLDVTLRGQAPLSLAGRFIAPNSVQGSLRYDLRMQGAPRLGAVAGEMTVDNARAAAPEAGITLEGISGRAALREGTATLDLGARLGDGGRLELRGPVTLAHGLPAQLVLTLDGARLTDGEIYTTRADGRVAFDGPLAGGGRISGRIDLGRTELRIPSALPPESVRLEALRHVGAPPEVRASLARAGMAGARGTTADGAAPGYALDLLVRVPERIFVRGRGLDAELGGQVRLRGTTADVAPAGLFRLIRGRLELLGRRFDLTEGAVDLRGTFDPHLRFVAATRADDTTIRIVIEGPASAPEIAFRSTPELPQEEVVARLLFGRDLSRISPFQAAQLASAVARLAGHEGADILGRLRSGFGLSDLDVAQTEAGGTEVTAGTYVSENIYSEVVIDSAGRQRINLNLDVTRSLTAKGGVSSDGDTGVGLFFERDY